MAPGGVTTGAPIPGTEPKPTDAQRRLGALATVVAPDAALVLGDGTPENPGVFDSLSDLGNQAAGVDVFGSKPGFGLAESDYQRGINALTNIAQSYLYAMSGQAAPAAEVQKIVATMLPVPFEDKKSVADKKARVATYVKAIQGSNLPPLNAPETQPPAAAPPPQADQVVDWTDYL